MKMKRMLAALLVVASVMSSCITVGATQASYDHIVDLTDGIFVYEKDGKYGYMDADGEMLTAAIYDSYNDFEEGCAIVIKDGLYGVVNTSGKEIIPTIYDDITYMGDMSDSDSSYYSYYFRVYKEKTMSSVICGNFDLDGNVITDFADGDELLKQRYITGEVYTNKIYIKDESGNVLGTYWLDTYPVTRVPTYQNGYCAVQDISGKQGIVDMDCNTVIPFIYDKTYDVNDGLARVCLDGKYGFVNMNNEVVVPIIYDDASDFSDGLAYVKSGDKYGFVNPAGEIVIDFIYDSVSELSQIDKAGDYTIFKVYSDNKLGFVSSENLAITDTVYNASMVSARENIIQVYSNIQGTHSFVHLETGELISDFVYANLYFGDFTLYWSVDGIIATCQGTDQWGYLSEHGDIILPFEYGYTYDFEDGYGKVRLTSNASDETYGYVDTEGNVVIPFEYSADEAEYALYEYLLSSSKTTETEPTVEPVTGTASPTTSTVFVDGEEVAFDAYNINNNNYFKLRDIAYILSGTDVSFEIAWSSARSAIDITTGELYTAVGGEMALGDGSAQSYKTSTAAVYIDGELVSLTAYTINNNNYYKLRDLGEALDFNVSWDSTAKCIVIESSESYSADS